MAVYAQTTTLDQVKAMRIGGSGPWGVVTGVCNLSNYNSTRAEITTITGQFISGGTLRIVPCSESSAGYRVVWDSASKAFKAFRTAASGAAITVSGTPLGSVAAPTVNIGSAAVGDGTAGIGIASGGTALVHSAAAVSGITGVQAPAFTGSNTVMSGGAATITGAADGEAPNDTNIGTFAFIAVGQIGG